MLVLQRKRYESIQIGPDITVTVVRLGREYVKLGIDAPKDVNVARTELLTQPRRGAEDRKAQDA